MEKGERKILEVQTESGELLLKLRIIVKDESEPEPPGEKGTTTKEKGGNGKSTEGGNGNKSGAAFEPMTDAQKRFLFRLLAGQGLEKEAAHEELKKIFEVDVLKKVTKLEASREIERRLAAQKGGAANGRA